MQAELLSPASPRRVSDKQLPHVLAVWEQPSRFNELQSGASEQSTAFKVRLAAVVALLMESEE
jgi:hypothetical protein